MAKKIRLIGDTQNDVKDDVKNTSLTETPNGDTINPGFTRDEIDQIMKTVEAIDWKLWELLKFTRKYEEAFPSQD
tara:strand:+ start:341 stop:565 length:225 start_codon:yes stop_codon:yes gene_type:complete